MWKTLKSLVVENKCDTISEIKIDNVIVTDQMIIADKFNNYFKDSIDMLMSNYKCSSYNTNITSQQPNNALNDFKLINLNELREIIFDMPNKSSTDEFDALFFKYCFDSIGLVLVNIINSCLLEGNIPETFKVSTIVPIQKKNNVQLILMILGL